MGDRMGLFSQKKLKRSRKRGLMQGHLLWASIE
jgi:hypothetical protein